MKIANRQAYQVQRGNEGSVMVTVTKSQTGSKSGWVSVAPVDPFIRSVRVVPVKWVSDVGFELSKVL